MHLSTQLDHNSQRVQVIDPLKFLPEFFEQKYRGAVWILYPGQKDLVSCVVFLDALKLYTRVYIHDAGIFLSLYHPNPQ